MVQLVPFADGLELWLDEEALVFIDLDDRAAVAAEVNPVATMITTRLAGPLCQPIFGVAVFLGGNGERSAGLSVEQLAELERLVALSAAVMARGESLGRARGTGPADDALRLLNGTRYGVHRVTVGEDDEVRSCAAAW